MGVFYNCIHILHIVYILGTYEVWNEIETKRNEIKENETKRNQQKRNEMKRNQRKQNEIN